MTKITAHLRYLRMSPRKVRLAAGVMKQKSAKKAELELRFLRKSAAHPLLKLLRSAMANARHNFHIDPSQLLIDSVRVDCGPTFKRFTPRARGMASPIHKRTSHITLILTEK